MAGRNLAIFMSSALFVGLSLQTQAAPMTVPHAGTDENQCYQAGSDVLVDCVSPAAVALSGSAKQDGMRTAVNPMSYARVGSYYKQQCVRDQVTGLIWEGKTAKGPRSGRNTFTNVGDGRDGDASTYVAYINSLALCGYTDWRLPTVAELHTLVDYGKPQGQAMLNLDWFVNSASPNGYWTSNIDASPGGVWYVDFRLGRTWARGSMYTFHVRLVRADK